MNKLIRLSRKKEWNGWKLCKRIHGMIEIDGGFCPKLGLPGNREHKIR